ncbi:cation diffusion facilitator family transporter [Pusillimonas sp. TS35]|uniref:cation diffusion facilitator family transporter n=1 Tax=Paracandidimonas lactea TaxID=2895524 RepID=UPI00136A65A9|nr:cation diffusion facilitator family transporter [Paracandidimonas lactea]MYN15067.1 cation diffusion facilitator family transporter [Pusillimonas sp. TS35]
MSHSHTSHDHDHHHGHSHAATVTRANERKVLISFYLIFVFMLVEAVGGWLSGSLALLADAGHMLTDAAALALAYAAFRLGRRGADSKRTFGYLRFEVIAGFVNAVTLFAIVGWILYEAWLRLAAPQPILAGPMLLVAAAGLLVNILVLWIMTRGETDHVNVRGAILHVIGDLLGSVGAIIAAVVVYYTGWTPIDPILSVVVSVLIVRSAWALLAKSMHILLEGAPDGASPEEVVSGLMNSVAGLAAVSHVHVWQLTSGRVMATLHVRPDDDNEARTVARRAQRVLKEQFNIEHATIAIDWNIEDDAIACSLQPSGKGGRRGRDHGHSHSHSQSHDHSHDHSHDLDHGHHRKDKS